MCDAKDFEGQPHGLFTQLLSQSTSSADLPFAATGEGVESPEAAGEKRQLQLLCKALSEN